MERKYFFVETLGILPIIVEIEENRKE